MHLNLAVLNTRHGRQAAEINMKKTSYIIVTLLTLNLLVLPAVFAQDSLAASAIGSSAFSIQQSSIQSGQEKLQALESTRFHFITLKQFHSSLFTVFTQDEKNKISELDAQILNAALNSFLTQAGREMTLLQALREERSVVLKFAIPEQEKYEVVENPDQPHAYQLEPVYRSSPASIEIKPLLDQSVAFEITLIKKNERYLYEVDWAGKITCITCLY